MVATLNKGLLKNSFIALLITCSHDSLAAYWPNRATAQGLLGANQLSGFLDGMLPLYGDAKRLLFIDGTMTGGVDSNSVASLGSGIRNLYSWRETPVIWGAFAFADYQQTKRTSAWLINPGIELMALKQEARLQAYLPVNGRSKAYGGMLTASNLPQLNIENARYDLHDFLFARGHQFYDRIVTRVDDYGTGGELELGQYLNFANGGWLRVGGYYFNFQNSNNVTGVQANLELYLGKQAALIVQDNYDNQNNNQISLGVRYTFGGLNRNGTELADRMLAPIIRHQSRQSYGMATPVRQSFKGLGSSVITDNIWYFSRFGTNPQFVSLASCTAEHPCLDLNQSIVNGIDAISQNAKLWFSTGQYTLPSTGNNGFVVLHDGQSISGRTAQFLQVAQGSQRPVINGGLWWVGDGTISAMQIINNGQLIPNFITGIGADAVIAVGASDTITVRNLAINLYDNFSALSTGLFANNVIDADRVTMNLNAIQAYGALSMNTIILNHVTANITTSSAGFGAFSNIGTVSLSNSSLTINSLGVGYGAAGFSGVLMDSSQLNVTGGIFSIGTASSIGSTTFIGNASKIQVNGPASNPILGDVVNASSPPSRCQVNGMPSENC